MAEFTSSFYSTKLHANVKGVSPRGGASIVETNDHLIVFGGADREPCHFQDMVIYRPAAGSKFESLNVKCENIPMPRSGHAVAAFGKYMFLFGGLDYPEEAVYNDLYLFSTENMEWYYVGESGLEVAARSSHSLGIVSGTLANGERKQYLVIYGGAAPEPGLFGDTIYSEIPSDPNSINPETFSVEWKSLTQPGPKERESHATCTSAEGHLYISGGKTGTEVPTLLQDVWRLSVNTAAADGEGSGDPLVWEQLKGLELPEPRCVHGMCVAGSALFIFGGFTGEMPSDLLTADLSAGEESTENAWRTISVAPEGRVGVSMCSVSPALVQRLTSSTLYSPLFRNQPVTETSDANIVIFGGSTMEKDLGDIWLLRKKHV